MDELASPAEPYRNDDLRELVDELPPVQKHLVERTYFGGVSVAEAASEWPISPAAAKQHLDKALVSLGASLSV